MLAAGQTKSLAVSNFSPEQLDCILQTAARPRNRRIGKRQDSEEHSSVSYPRTTKESSSTVDKIHLAPPKKPWNDDSPVDTKKQWPFMVSRQDFVHSMHPHIMYPEGSPRTSLLEAYACGEKMARCGHKSGCDAEIGRL